MAYMPVSNCYYQQPYILKIYVDQGFTNSFSLSTHRKWLSSGVAVVKLSTRVSESSSIKLRLKR